MSRVTPSSNKQEQDHAQAWPHHIGVWQWQAEHRASWALQPSPGPAALVPQCRAAAIWVLPAARLLVGTLCCSHLYGLGKMKEQRARR